MSKGLGRVERALLDELALCHRAGLDWRSTPDFVAGVMAEGASVRRALGALERKGLALRQRRRGMTAWRLVNAPPPANDPYAEILPERRDPELRRAIAKIARILGMIGSAHDAEALTAARAAAAAVKKLGLTWNDLLE